MASISSRSCVSCYRRKVKCDKSVPSCSVCIDSRQKCEYPQGPIRRHRARRQVNPIKETDQKNAEGPSRSRSTSSDAGIGRLIIDGGGKSRFLSSNSWVNIEDEDNTLKRTILDQAAPRLDLRSGFPFSFIFGRNYHDLSDYSGVLHDPWRWSPHHITTCWTLYKNNVDPVVRILHKPSIEKVIEEATTSGLGSLEEATAALVVAICYAAVVTLDPQLAVRQFGVEHGTLVREHEYAVEMAMARAGWICSDHIQVLQAFVLLLSCMSREDNRLVWTLTGLALRIATSLGLHHDGVAFGLSPFQIDMRARLWWQLCLIEVRTSEDYGTDGSFLSRSTNSRMPLNVNDNDWKVGAPPQEHQGATEMTFSLIRFEGCRALSRIWAASRLPSPADSKCKTGKTAFEMKEQFIDGFSTVMEAKYLRYLDAGSSTVPVHRMSAETGRAFLTKLRLIAHYPTLKISTTAAVDKSDLEPSVRHEFFLSAIDLLEFQKRLSSAEYMANFHWLASHYPQWHATAFVLSHLYSLVKTAEPEDRPLSPALLHRVLQVIPFAFDMTTRFDTSAGNIHHWRPLERLWQRTMKELERIQPGNVEIASGSHFESFKGDEILDGEFQDTVLDSFVFPDIQEYDWESIWNGPW